jgi:hypothetical protein
MDMVPLMGVASCTGSFPNNLITKLVSAEYRIEDNFLIMACRTNEASASICQKFSILSLRKPVIPLIHSILLHSWKHMRIRPQCHADLAVPQQFLYYFRRDPHTQ